MKFSSRIKSIVSMVIIMAALVLPLHTQKAQAFSSEVLTQQKALNSILNPYGFPKLLEDGIFGQYTSQALCVWRWTTGPVGRVASRDPMIATNWERKALVELKEQPNATSLYSKLLASNGMVGRDLAIKKICQAGVAMHNGVIKYIMPVSTGKPGYDTREGSFFVYQYLSKSGQEKTTTPLGWFDSNLYPSTSGNGNMYLSLFFSGGQAVHGSRAMPDSGFLTYPESMGCVRTRPTDQDKLVKWMFNNSTTISYDWKAYTATNSPLVIHVRP
jgi:hypothetical protein